MSDRLSPPRALRCLIVLILFLIPSLSPSPALAKKEPASEPTAGRFDPSLFQAMEWRNIGPFRGGRSTAVAGVPDEPFTYYFGGTGGGLWRTTDGGLNWENISDGHFETGSVGAIAVAPSDANVIYVGMGEAPVRGVMTTHGDGVYRTTDGGRSWQHLGLDETRHISRVRVHPDDPDTVWVAAQGHLWGPNPERGIYKSTDGGHSWRQVLWIDATTGASDLSLDATNPRILYAALWQHRRWPWKIESGGPGSGLWKSTDGGESWEKLTEGLPELMGKVRVAVSPADPQRVWAMVEAEEGGLYRSEDGGQSWRLRNDEQVLRGRPWYYTHVFADPQNADVVWVLNAPAMKSIDGGKTFTRVNTPHGDNHDLWINPRDPRWMINANDGGANVSFNGGRSWTTQGNQPTAQFYRVITDDQFPYKVYGGQQDNSSVAILSRSMEGGITERHWHEIGGCETAYPAFDPDNPRYVYAGCYQGIISEYDTITESRRDVMAYPFVGLGSKPADLRYRFNWNAPIVASPHDPTTIYHAGNVVLKTTDRGRSWQEISPDLTRNEPEKQGPGGGPITSEGAGGETYNTILSLVASSHEAGVLWVGTDDGLVHLTRDGGANWQAVTPPGIGEAMINAIEISPHDPGTAYLAVTLYKWDDLRPIVFKTADYGATWSDLAAGIPDGTIVRVVREDPARRGLLYAGTENGLYVSWDDGARWQKLQLNLPVVPITDLTLRHHDLVASTQGRAFWILDDVTPFHHVDDEVAAAELYLLPPRATWRTGGYRWRWPGAYGANPPNGVLIHYLLAGAPAPELILAIYDAEGRLVRRVTSTKAEEEGEGEEGPRGREGGEDVLSTKPGMNRYVWDLRYQKLTRIPGTLEFPTGDGHRVAPGSYRLELSRGEVTLSRELEVLEDPRRDTRPEEYRVHQESLVTLRERVHEIHDAVNRLAEVKEQIEALLERVEERAGAEEIREAGDKLVEAIETLDESLVQRKTKTHQDIINFPNRLNAEYIWLYAQIDGSGPPVSKGAKERFAELEGRWREHQAEMERLIGEELAAFNELFRKHEIPAVILPEPEPAMPVEDEEVRSSE
ncbi:MAG: glycosyl hydrolase [bacterium]|nr:glycosyl hydrolase [bacterium]